jgi:hypothetical protein
VSDTRVPEEDGHLDEVFDLDLTNVPDDFGESDSDWSYTASATTVAPAPELSPVDRLEALLEPYSVDSLAKARTLIRKAQIQEVKADPDGMAKWFNVMGSKLYVSKISHGEGFLFAECSCPNGTHRGGDAICYHSIAARVMDAGLADTWMGL